MSDWSIPQASPENLDQACAVCSPLEHDAVKLENAKVLYENSEKTADEVCKVVGVGRRIFFTYLAEQREMTHTQ